MDDVFIHEDDWGMVALEAEENRFERAKMVKEARAHGEANQDASAGWTSIYVAPAAPIELAGRGITLEAVRGVLGVAWPQVPKVTTGYWSHREPVRTGFAFRHPSRAMLYGCVSDRGVVNQLNLNKVTRESVEPLHELGLRYRLILCDLWSDRIVELGNRAAVEAHITSDDE